MESAWRPGVASLVLGVLATALPAQPGRFGERVEVELVLVDVLVTDGAGRSVLDLGPGDFRLFEDGLAVEISQFSPPEAQPDREDRAVAVPGPSAGAPRPAHRDEPERVVVFLDELHMSLASRRRAIRQIAEVLEAGLPDAAEVMIVSYTGRLTTVFAMSPDRGAARHRLAEYAKEDGQIVRLVGLEDERALETIYAVFDRSIQKEGFLAFTYGEDPVTRRDPCAEAALIAQLHAEQVHNRVIHTIESLREFAVSLAAFPGRKTLLYVSDGLPLIAGQEALQYASSMCDGTGAAQGLEKAVDRRMLGEVVGSDGILAQLPDTTALDLSRFNTHREWGRLTADANTVQVSLYTLQASGLEAPRAGQHGLVQMTQSTEFVSQKNDQDPLFFAADETGGRAIFDTNDFRADLEGMLADGHLRYELAFAPGRSPDGKVHRLDVEVARPSVRVRHRKSYHSKGAHERVTDGVLASLYHQREENLHGARLEVVETERPGDGDVIVRLAVPLERLSLLPDGDGGQGLFTVFLTARDERGNGTEVGQKTIPVRVGPADLGQDYVYEVALPLPSGREYRVAAALRDEVGGETSYLTTLVRLRDR